MRRIERKQWVPYPVEEVFPFFAHPGNLERITPPWLHFRIITPGVEMKKNSFITYKLRWRGLPLAWLTEITDWDPPYGFIDVQRKGPYRQWIHEHRFKDAIGGTLIMDQVDYSLPGWILEPLMYKILVGSDLHRIFNFRQRKIAEIFNA